MVASCTHTHTPRIHLSIPAQFAIFLVHGQNVQNMVLRYFFPQTLAGHGAKGRHCSECFVGWQRTHLTPILQGFPANTPSMYWRICRESEVEQSYLLY